MKPTRTVLAYVHDKKPEPPRTVYVKMIARQEPSEEFKKMEAELTAKFLNHVAAVEARRTAEYQAAVTEEIKRRNDADKSIKAGIKPFENKHE